MKIFKQIICPISDLSIDENKVRITALLVVISMGGYFFSGNWLIPGFLAFDFFLRAFTRLKNSPLSWLSALITSLFRLKPVMINRGPKIFAARIGFILTVLTTILGMLDFHFSSIFIGSVLVTFAFLECGLNFCAGCWIYSSFVYPLFQRRD